jgi:hypothetical protein
LKFVFVVWNQKRFPERRNLAEEIMMMVEEAGYQFCLLLSASRMNVRQQVKGTCSRRHSVTTFQRWKLSIGVCLLSVSLPDANFGFKTHNKCMEIAGYGSRKERFPVNHAFLEYFRPTYPNSSHTLLKKM